MEEERKNRLAMMLRELRGERSQAEVAKEAGISRATLSYYENMRGTTDDTLAQLAEYYHVSADTLLGLSIGGEDGCDYCTPSAGWMPDVYWTEWKSDTDINTGFLRCSLDHYLGLNRTSRGFFEIRSAIGSGDSYRALRIAVNYCPVCGRKLM